MFAMVIIVYGYLIFLMLAWIPMSSKTVSIDPCLCKVQIEVHLLLFYYMKNVHKY